MYLWGDARTLIQADINRMGANLLDSLPSGSIQIAVLFLDFQFDILNTDIKNIFQNTFQILSIMICLVFYARGIIRVTYF